MFLVRRLLFLFLANEWAAVGVSSMDPTVNGLNLFTDPLVLKWSSRYIEGSTWMMDSKLVSGPLRMYQNTFLVERFIRLWSSQLSPSLILTHTRARQRESCEDYETINKERILLQLKRSSLESMSTLGSTYPWLDLSTLGSMDPCTYRQSIFRRLGAGYSVMGFLFANGFFLVCFSFLLFLFTWSRMCSKENVYVHKPVYLIGLKGVTPVPHQARGDKNRFMHTLSNFLFAYPLKLSILILNSTWTDVTLLCPVRSSVQPVLCSRNNNYGNNDTPFYVLFLQTGAHSPLESKEQNS